MISEFYGDKYIFLTGGSGILGRGLIEKLLRSTEVKCIYMLLRERKGVSIEDRLTKIKEGIIFRRLRKENPQALDKLIGVKGDICNPLLGFSEETFKLIENVNIFIHSAATVRFDEPLRKSIKLNVAGTYECVQVAQKLKNLKLFVHVSTFYSNPYLKIVDNILYPAPMDWRVALKMVQGDFNDEEINALTRKFIKGFPNTYTFTKNLSENVVNDHKHLFPVLITRPSIIIYSKNEPEPGYVETLYGITGVTSAFGTGLLRTIYASPDTIIDIIYLDLVVNLHILNIVRFLTIVESSDKRLEIALMCAGYLDPYKLSKRLEMTRCALSKTPFVKSIWNPRVTITPCIYQFKLRFILYQVLPSLLLDLVLRAFRIKPIVMSLQRKLYMGALEMHYFLTRTYKSNGVSFLFDLQKLDLEEKFDVKSMIFIQLLDSTAKSTYEEFVMSSRRYILKEKDESIPYAKKQYRILKYLDLTMKLIFWFVVARFVFRKVFGTI